METSKSAFIPSCVKALHSAYPNKHKSLVNFSPSSYVINLRPKDSRLRAQSLSLLESDFRPTKIIGLSVHVGEEFLISSIH